MFFGLGKMIWGKLGKALAMILQFDSLKNLPGLVQKIQKVL